MSEQGQNQYPGYTPTPPAGYPQGPAPGYAQAPATEYQQNPVTGYAQPAFPPPVQPDEQLAAQGLAVPVAGGLAGLASQPPGIGNRVDITEKEAPSMSGGLAFLLIMLMLLGGIGLVVISIATGTGIITLLGVLLGILGLLASSSLTVVQPGDTKVLQFLGKYVGTIRRTGMQLTLPWTAKKTVSVKVHNVETREIKVNDSDGNPVNIAAIIVWQVSDTAKATFAVENSEQFVYTQSEAALRHVASSHPYDNAPAGEETLRGSTDKVAKELADEVSERVAIAGIEIIEARISSLAYASEIAQAMLQRQQAAAVIAARTMIVEGAVGMVEQALRRLEADNVVTMNDDRKAAMVSNLLVVLCGESRATPVVSTSLHASTHD